MANAKDGNQLTADELRRQAEERVLSKMGERPLPQTFEEMQRLVHELEVHQIELEMQNEELLQARELTERTLARYTDLYDFAPVGYFTLDGAGIIRSLNLSGATLLGIERARLLGRHFGGFVPVEARTSFVDFLERVRARRCKESCEIPLTPRANILLYVRIEALAEVSKAECRLAVIDITARRASELELAGKTRELEEINGYLESRIASAVDDLRQKDQMLIMQDRLSVMGEMINNIAHQWNQPLNLLGLVIQQLPFHYDSGELSREVLKDNVAKGMELIQHMSQTIEDFRSLFKDDKEATTFRVNKVISRTLSLIEKTFKDQKINIVLNVEGDPMVTGFPNEYSQVLLNILLNARDAVTERSVGGAQIALRVFEEGGRSVVTITDNAGGIAEEIIGKLFDAYFTTKGPEKGTGIGLYMAKVIIEKSMKGRLTVRNIEGGAEFRIEI